MNLSLAKIERNTRLIRKQHLVHTLIAFLVIGASFTAQGQQGTRTVDFVMEHGSVDYADLSRRSPHTVKLGKSTGTENLESFAIGYKGWNLLGEYVYNPTFIYALNSGALQGTAKRVRFSEISKYPDLVKRYNAIKPTSVNYIAIVRLRSKGRVVPVKVKVTDGDLAYFESRSPKNFNVPTSPPNWKSRISMDMSESAFSTADRSVETELKLLLKDLEGTVSVESGFANVLIDIKWPGGAIDEIGKLYDDYEKKKTAKQEVAAEAEKDQGLKKAAGGDDFWNEAAENPVTVTLDRDLNGTSTATGVIDVSGTVKGPASLVGKGTITAEGYTQPLDIRSGRFSSKVVLKSGVNRILINFGTKSISQNVTLTRRPVALRATLTWNTSATDIDLYMTDPTGARCSYNAKSSGSMQLDVDNTSGFGPENIFVQRAIQGQYSISVQNYSRGTGTEATVYVYVNEELKGVKKVRFTADKQFIGIGSFTF